MSKVGKPILTLKQFIMKQEVKSLYRRIFRTIRQVPDAQYQNELKEWARRDFRSNAHHQDEITIKMCITQGNRALKELEGSLSLARS